MTKSFIREGNAGSEVYHLNRCVPKRVADSEDSLPRLVPEWQQVGHTQLRPLFGRRKRNCCPGVLPSYAVWKGDFTLISGSPPLLVLPSWALQLAAPRTISGEQFSRGYYHYSEHVDRLFHKALSREPMELDALTKFIRDWPESYGCEGTKRSAISDQLASFEQGVLEGLIFPGKSLFKMAKGMLGFGYAVIRTGDVVALLWGVHTPLILRP
ncbi:hypothetical protein EDB81DRAFT_757635 [Dactylonectria macrodidyma]|uniref:Uncharacterized protein n=1 Tax=Dactylonectria macrodidyma TaxID=307937 RepID=A0A9P9F3P9_9HYPO|nr:hypothetical protein EDB81DRAFT_757635 [Dactylonectria macrodidyma]